LKKSLLILTLVVLGCSFASAQSFGFLSAGKSIEYCNYEILVQLTPYAIWEGDDILTPCGVSYNATIAGATTSLSKVNNPLGFALKGVGYADNIYDAFSEFYTGAQWYVISNLKCSEKKLGWLGLASVSSVIFGDNYGYLWPCGPEAKKAAANGHGLSTGSAKAPARK
jgi:hypothetical protein